MNLIFVHEITLTKISCRESVKLLINEIYLLLVPWGVFGLFLCGQIPRLPARTVIFYFKLYYKEPVKIDARSGPQALL